MLTGRSWPKRAGLSWPELAGLGTGRPAYADRTEQGGAGWPEYSEA